MKQIWSLLIILLSLNSLIGETSVLDLEKALSLAYENDRDLQGFVMYRDQSRKDLDRSWNLLVPSVSASVSGGQSWYYNDLGYTESQNLSTRLGMSYQFNPSISQQFQSRKLEAETQSLALQSSRLQLMVAVETEFYYLITAAENLEISRKNIELAEKSYELTRIRFENGRASQLELMQAQVNAANEKPSYSSQVAAYRNRMKEFLLRLGLDPDSDIELDGSLDVVPVDVKVEDLIGRYLENKISLKQQRTQLKAAENSLKLYRRDNFFPDLGISGSWNRNLDEPLEPDPSLSDSLSLTLSLSLSLDPILPGSQVKRSIERQEASLELGRGNLEYRLQQASLEIVNLYNSLKTDQERLELSRLNNELAQTSYDLTENQYNMGRVDRLTLDSSLQDLSRSRYNLLQSKYQYISDLIALKGALGTETWDEWK